VLKHRSLAAPEFSQSALHLRQKIQDKTAMVGIVGLGYVGMPLAMEFVRAGFRVTGFDISTEKVAKLQRGENYIGDVDGALLKQAVASGQFQATSDPQCLSSLDTINICVPTPLSKTKDPDMSFVMSANEEIAKRLRPSQLIILESTTYPGTTEEVLLPLFSKSGLQVGVDFFLCFSPERVDPGNQTFQTRNIPKVVGGVTPTCIEIAKLFYQSALETVVAVSSTRTAETVKLLENTFRLVNIGLVNEVAIMCQRMGIDVWEVIDAAATKPFGFMPFYPGPGLGGHCIPVDPFYLSWKSKQAGAEAQFIELAGRVNANMPQYVVERLLEALNDEAKPLRGSKIHLLGVSYKRDIDDTRESPAIDIMHLLREKGAVLSYSDPHVAKLHSAGIHLSHIDPLLGASQSDCVLITTDHRAFDYRGIAERAKLVFDTRNACRGLPNNNIVRL
jgi:UDP-N-acetyl-D-glucosamine dehydrogenase